MALSVNAGGAGGKGVRDWLLQRGSSVILGAYFVFMVVFLLTHPDMEYTVWRNLFDAFWMRIFSSLALLSLAVHAWIGLWTIATDYLRADALGGYGLALRMVFLFFVGVSLISYLLFGFRIFWL